MLVFMAAIDERRNKRDERRSRRALLLRCRSRRAAIENKKAAVEEERVIPFLLRPFSTVAAAGGRTSCRTSQNFAAIGALLYDAVI